MVRWLALPLAALALGVTVEAAPLRMWDEVVNRPLQTIRSDAVGPGAQIEAEVGAFADDRAGRTGASDPVVDPAFETILIRSEALTINTGPGRPGDPTLPVPEATTLVFVGLALAGVASGRKLFKR